MRPEKSFAVLLLLIVVTSVAAAGISADDIDLRVAETEMERGETLEATVHVSEDVNDTDLEYIFALEEESFTTDEPRFSHEVDDPTVDSLTVTANDTGTGTAVQDTVDITVHDGTEDTGSCREDIEAAQDITEAQEMCTDEFAEMQCPHDEDVTHGASDGCEIEALEEHGWERVSATGEEEGDETDDTDDAVGDVSLTVEPDEIEQGEPVHAEVAVGGELREDLTYDWREQNIVATDTYRHDGDIIDEDRPLYDADGPDVTFDARDDGRTPDASLQVQVWDDDTIIHRAEAEVDWAVHEPDTDGMDIEYYDTGIDVVLSEEELDNRPEFRAGTALDAWDEIMLEGRNVVGGIEIEMQELAEEDYDADDDLIPYSVVQLNGENIDGVGLHLQADVSHDWLIDNDLIMTNQHADISFYRVEGSNWEKLSSATTHANIDNHIGLQADPERTAQGDHDFHLSGDETMIGIAGDPDGIDAGRFAVGPAGECDELSDNEPVPGGWEEIDVPCDVHDQVERTEDQLDRFDDRMRAEADDADIDLDERISEIESLIAEYRLFEADEKIRTLQDEIRESAREVQDEERSDQQREQMEQRMQRYTDRYPEAIQDLYERPEHIQDLYDQALQHIEEGDDAAAAEVMDEFEQEKQEADAFQELERAGSIYNTIERLEERDAIEEDHREGLEEAERLLLEEQDVAAAEELVDSVEDDVQTAQMREQFRELLEDPEIRRMIRNVVADMIPGL